MSGDSVGLSVLAESLLLIVFSPALSVDIHQVRLSSQQSAMFSAQRQPGLDTQFIPPYPISTKHWSQSYNSLSCPPLTRPDTTTPKMRWWGVTSELWTNCISSISIYPEHNGLEGLVSELFAHLELNWPFKTLHWPWHHFLLFYFKNVNFIYKTDWWLVEISGDSDCSLIKVNTELKTSALSAVQSYLLSVLWKYLNE